MPKLGSTETQSCRGKQRVDHEGSGNGKAFVPYLRALQKGSI